MHNESKSATLTFDLLPFWHLIYEYVLQLCPPNSVQRYFILPTYILFSQRQQQSSNNNKITIVCEWIHGYDVQSSLLSIFLLHSSTHIFFCDNKIVARRCFSAQRWALNLFLAHASKHQDYNVRHVTNRNVTEAEKILIHSTCQEFCGWMILRIFLSQKCQEKCQHFTQNNWKDLRMFSKRSACAVTWW